MTRLSSAQWNQLTTNDDGVLTGRVDRRSLAALERRGLIRGELHGRGRRQRVRWVLTDSGEKLIANPPKIVDPHPRPDWRAFTHVRVDPRRYEVEDHHLLRSATRWRVMCPDRGDDPVAFAECLAEAVDVLAHHWRREECASARAAADAFRAEMAESRRARERIWPYPV